MTEAEVKDKLRAWIVSHSKKQITDHDITDDTPVIEAGYLSSLDVVEFVLYIESLLDDEIDLEALEPEVFTSTRTMYETLFARNVLQ